MMAYAHGFGTTCSPCPSDFTDQMTICSQKDSSIAQMQSDLVSVQSELAEMPAQLTMNSFAQMDPGPKDYWTKTRVYPCDVGGGMNKEDSIDDWDNTGSYNFSPSLCGAPTGGIVGLSAMDASVYALEGEELAATMAVEFNGEDWGFMGRSLHPCLGGA